jgi:hypothetical protein
MGMFVNEVVFRIEVLYIWHEYVLHCKTHKIPTYL